MSSPRISRHRSCSNGGGEKPERRKIKDKEGVSAAIGEQEGIGGDKGGMEGEEVKRGLLSHLIRNEG